MISLIILAGCSDAKMANSNAAALGGDDPAAEGGSEEFEDLEGEAAEDTAEPSAQAPEAEDTPLSESSWSIVLDTEISHPTNMAGFLNESFVITVGPYGEIHYSVDGGQTWPEGENESMCRFSLDIVDENIAWCGGAGNNVRSSVDGGKTWRALEDVDLGEVTQISTLLTTQRGGWQHRKSWWQLMMQESHGRNLRFPKGRKA